MKILGRLFTIRRCIDLLQNGGAERMQKVKVFIVRFICQYILFAGLYYLKYNHPVADTAECVVVLLSIAGAWLESLYDNRKEKKRLEREAKMHKEALERDELIKYQVRARLDERYKNKGDSYECEEGTS